MIKVIFAIFLLTLAGCTTTPEPVTTVEVVKPVFKVPPALAAIPTPVKPQLAYYDVTLESETADVLKASYISIIQLNQYSKSLEDTLAKYREILKLDALTQKKE